MSKFWRFFPPNFFFFFENQIYTKKPHVSQILPIFLTQKTK
jgi:hypothetical protein